MIRRSYKLAHAVPAMRPVRLLLALLTAMLVAGCGTTAQRHSTIRDNPVSLTRAQLQAGGLAFITPSTVTGQEEDRQGLALTFASILRQNRPELRCLSLSEALGAINKAGLSDDYKKMYEEYRSTGMLGRDRLRAIGKAAGVRYLAQLNLADFRQSSNERFGILGFRMVQTKGATIRVFMQLWDTQDGSIAWEATQELDYANETLSERSVTFQAMSEETARNLVARLP